MFVKVSNTANEIVHNAANDLSARAFRQQASLYVVQCSTSKRILVVKRLKDFQIGLPCGKIDATGESPIEAANRELYEETGVLQRHLGVSRYLASILFDGTLVHVFKSTVANEQCATGPAPGFECETIPQWVTIDELVNTESRFQSFNIVALHKAGLF